MAASDWTAITRYTTIRGAAVSARSCAIRRSHRHDHGPEKLRSMKETLLFLSAHLPAPDASEAGQVCAFHNLEILSRRFDVHLVAFRTDVSSNWSSEPVEKICASTKIFRLT